MGGIGERVGAVVLCGGASRRMGRSKALLPFGPENMLQRTVRSLRAVCSPLVVVAAAEQQLPPLADVQVIRDPTPGLGPLQGIAAGLAALSGQVEYAFVAATDMPLLRAELVAALVELCGDHQLVVPKLDGHLHPLAALYACSLHAGAAELLNQGERRVVSLAERVATRRVSRADLLGYAPLARVDPELCSVRNLNTLGDYRQTLHDAGFVALDDG